MQGSHRSSRRSARPVAALVSVLALLALACFPVGVQAETVYESEETTLPGETKLPHTQKNNPLNESSEEEAEKSEAPPSGGESNGTDGGSEGEAESPGLEGGSGNGQPSQEGGSQAGNGSQDQGPKIAKLGDSQPVPTGGNGSSPSTDSLTGNGSPAATDDGSSSPLIPILIAIAALAAISIGAVVIRQRRQGGGPDGQFSQKAS